MGETGLDTVRRYATPDEQRRLFDASSSSPTSAGRPRRPQPRGRRGDRGARSQGFAGTVVLHCFSSPALAPGDRPRLLRLVRRKRRRIRRRADLREAAAAIPSDRHPGRDGQPLPRPAARARARANEPANLVHTLAALAEARGETSRSSRRDARERRRRVRAAVSVAPKKSLGQHFLVDENILGVIGRLADLAPEDVVLEIGPGLGVLTRYLADRVASSTPSSSTARSSRALRDALGARDNVALVWGDALRARRRRARAAPGKLVANLPYNIATPLVVETLEHAASLTRWCVMVQREVADRFFASRGRRRTAPCPSSSSSPRARPASTRAADGLPSAAARGFGSRRLRAPRDAPIGRVRGVVEAAFAHRRKTLANSIALTGLATRARVEEALAVGRPRPGGAGRGDRAAPHSSRSPTRFR